ncbi:hypothetical protein [Mycobacterium sp. 48b]|uniref:hypothetical protein n=1 Tax=Mycobacterium sp. 48b TaxID=3400426 RepID=UPI003AAB47CB
MLLRKKAATLADRVIEAANHGVPLTLTDHRPTYAHSGNTIAASVVHDAVTGEKKSLHRRGLQLAGFYIDGDVDLSFLSWQGQLSLVNCYINGSVILDYARPVGEIRLDGSMVRRVSARSATIDGNFFLRDGFHADEGIYAIGLTVKNSISMRHARIVAPREPATRMAVEIFRGRFGDVFLHHATFEGGIYAAGITVERNIRLQASRLTSRTEMGWPHNGAEFKGAVTLAGSEVKGSIYLSTASTRNQLIANDAISLSATNCNQVFLDAELLTACAFHIDGFRYSRLRGIEGAQLLQWLNSHKTVQRNAYTQLAEHCRNVGDLSCQRKVLLSLERKITQNLPRWSPTRLMRSLHDGLIGYGYLASKAIPWLLMTVALASVVIHSGRQFVYYRPRNAGGTLSQTRPNWHDSFAITIDNFLPFASLGVKESWVVILDTLQQWPWFLVFLLLKFAAWALAALALVSFTSAVRKVS